jgi:UDP-3-O-[3-hydroxymyristoyl] glucosamine N-acyltransferase
MSLSLGELAVRFGCELRGDPGLRVERVASLAHAGPGTLSFLANALYRAQLASTRATAVVLSPEAAADSPVAALVSPNPYAAYARIATLLHPPREAPAGVHPAAVVAAGAQIHPTAHVGPLAVVGAGVVVGERAFVGPHCVIEEGARLGEDVRLVARVTVCRDVTIGARSLVQPGAVIGADGFGFAQQDGQWIKVPQVGAVRVGADVEIGANTTIDRGAIDDTTLEDGVKLDNQIQVGHNVRIGAHTAVAACVGISGSTTIGARCMIGGAVGIVGHLSICDDVAITGFTMVSHSITKPGVYSGGIPAEDARAWRRIVARLKRIDSLAQRLGSLERANPGKTDHD